MSLVFQWRIECSANFANSKAPVKRLFWSTVDFVTVQVHTGPVFTQTVCVFKTPGVLRSHLSRSHTTVRIQENSTFLCDLCDFKEICSEKTFWNHLGRHIKNRETVPCPILRCNFKTNTRSTFSSHRSRNHKNCTLKDFRTIARADTEDDANDGEQFDGEQSDGETAGTASQSSVRPKEVEEFPEVVDSETLQHKLASLFLCMQTVLHVLF